MNQFRLKREAHTDSSSWNPFGHTFKRTSLAQRETWDGPALETQALSGDDDTTLPLEHAQIADVAPVILNTAADKYGEEPMESGKRHLTPRCDGDQARAKVGAG